MCFSFTIVPLSLSYPIPSAIPPSSLSHHFVSYQLVAICRTLQVEILTQAVVSHYYTKSRNKKLQTCVTLLYTKPRNKKLQTQEWRVWNKPKSEPYYEKGTNKKAIIFPNHNYTIAKMMNKKIDLFLSCYILCWHVRILQQIPMG